MSFFTSFCDLPQKEQRRVSSVLLTISGELHLRLFGLFQVCGRDERVGDFIARQKLIKATDTFIADERALVPASSFRSMRRAGDNIGNLAARLSAERATNSTGFHPGNHLLVGTCVKTCATD